MKVDLNRVRVGDQLHTSEGIVEISRPITNTIDGSFEVWGYKGDLFGEVDQTVEVAIRPDDLEEMVTSESLIKRLKATPQYQAGLIAGYEELLDFMRSKAFAWYEDEARDAILNLAVAFERKLQQR